ncbi:hypothetical protein EJD97_003965 [Solanum chilense]|uniref:Uncharacterized protein n=1 Tax=Solanum chilense TaxID=4083 RepID=A0A6N2BY87_SOLCI|nr:hypothetical protein EJD97_003965 [Solanum chilense]
MRLRFTNMQARKMLFAYILSICASSSKLISFYNEEMIVISIYCRLYHIHSKGFRQYFQSYSR